MTEHVWKQMASGRIIDLANLKPEDIYWPDFVEALCKIPRYDGATPGIVYTVGQHCCLAHDVAPKPLKAHAFLHDFHEALIGDISTPAVNLLASVAYDPVAVRDAVRTAKEDLDEVIYAAAGGLTAPHLDFQIAQAVKSIDLSLLITEKRDLLLPAIGYQKAWPSGIEPYAFRIDPWDEARTRANVEARLETIGVSLEEVKDAA